MGKFGAIQAARDTQRKVMIVVVGMKARVKTRNARKRRQLEQAKADAVFFKNAWVSLIRIYIQERREMQQARVVRMVSKAAWLREWAGQCSWEAWADRCMATRRLSMKTWR